MFDVNCICKVCMKCCLYHFVHIKHLVSVHMPHFCRFSQATRQYFRLSLVRLYFNTHFTIDTVLSISQKPRPGFKLSLGFPCYRFVGYSVLGNFIVLLFRFDPLWSALGDCLLGHFWLLWLSLRIGLTNTSWWFPLLGSWSLLSGTYWFLLFGWSGCFKVVRAVTYLVFDSKWKIYIAKSMLVEGYLNFLLKSIGTMPFGCIGCASTGFWSWRCGLSRGSVGLWSDSSPKARPGGRRLCKSGTVDICEREINLPFQPHPI